MRQHREGRAHGRRHERRVVGDKKASLRRDVDMRGDEERGSVVRNSVASRSEEALESNDRRWCSSSPSSLSLLGSISGARKLSRVVSQSQ